MKKMNRINRMDEEKNMRNGMKTNLDDKTGGG